MTHSRIGAVIIGRNEGDRLINGLRSLQNEVSQIVYVDSGSTDGSVAKAEDMGAQTVLLDRNTPFTAARARNAGLAALRSSADVDYVQFVDGDCEVREGWIETASVFLDSHPDAAVVCGRRRERFPEATIYNGMIDKEWDTPLGKVRSCGGDALMRVNALDEVHGFNPSMIAGEEPELCVRLRAAGWTIHRIETEMTWHDAAIFKFSQWWKRARRAGHAYAEGAALHGAPPERHNISQRRSALFWGGVVPLVGIVCTLVSPWGLTVLLALPLQAFRLGLKTGDWVRALFFTLAKFPEIIGIMDYHIRRLSGQSSTIIEYK